MASDWKNCRIKRENFDAIQALAKSRGTTAQALMNQAVASWVEANSGDVSLRVLGEYADGMRDRYNLAVQRFNSAAALGAALVEDPPAPPEVGQGPVTYDHYGSHGGDIFDAITGGKNG